MRTYGAAKWVTVLAAGSMLAACETTVPQYRLPPPLRTAPPDTAVYAAPNRGQSTDQLDRDRYECSQWATQQTGFDPSRPLPPPPQRSSRVVVTGPAPGSGVAVGAVSGAVIGAAVSNPWNPGPGTLVGLAAGAIVGGAIENSQRQQAEQLAAQASAASGDNAQYVRDPGLEAQAANYRRAMSACLDARGYSVR